MIIGAGEPAAFRRRGYNLARGERGLSRGIFGRGPQHAAAAAGCGGAASAAPNGACGGHPRSVFKCPSLPMGFLDERKRPFCQDRLGTSIELAARHSTTGTVRVAGGKQQRGGGYVFSSYLLFGPACTQVIGDLPLVQLWAYKTAFL